jgi:hypothetical protein
MVKESVRIRPVPLAYTANSLYWDRQKEGSKRDVFKK